MTGLIWQVSLVCFAFIVGFYMGARFVTPRKTKIKAASFPPDVVDMGQWRRLDLPAQKRRQRIGAIDV